jgi:hypothetical protein
MKVPDLASNVSHFVRVLRSLAGSLIITEPTEVYPRRKFKAVI